MISAQKKAEIISHTPSETETVGRALAKTLQPSDLVVLTGPLGAGKTCFIKGVALGLGVDEEAVKSPSFTLVNEYYGRLPLFHFDLYRLKEPSELYQIGWDDYLLRDGVVVVEWGEKAEGYLPPERIDITIDIIDEHTRKIQIDYRS